MTRGATSSAHPSSSRWRALPESRGLCATKSTGAGSLSHLRRSRALGKPPNKPPPLTWIWHGQSTKPPRISLACSDSEFGCRRGNNQAELAANYPAMACAPQRSPPIYKTVAWVSPPPHLIHRCPHQCVNLVAAIAASSKEPQLRLRPVLGLWSISVAWTEESLTTFNSSPLLRIGTISLPQLRQRL